MSNTTRQKTTEGAMEVKAVDGGGAASGLPDAQAEVDRLFAVASKAFENMSEGNSQEFLRRSRQTGVQ